MDSRVRGNDMGARKLLSIWGGPGLGGFFGVGQLGVAAVVAALADEKAGLGESGAVLEEAGAGELDVSEVQGHGAALGDGLSLVEIGAGGGGVAVDMVQPSTGDEAAEEIVCHAGIAEAGDGGAEVTAGLIELGGPAVRRAEQGGVEGGPAEGEVVEADIEEPAKWLVPFQQLGGALGDGGAGCRAGGSALLAGCS